MTEQRARRRRQCGPKVKTGCLVCKIRRVKCDEEKPACRRCASTGRKCEYSFDTSTHTPPGGSSDLALSFRINIHIPGSSEEKRGFNYFLKNTAQELSGYYTSSFWESLILQASSAEPSLRHAVIAIGSLHEDFQQKKLKYSHEDTSFAIGQYTKGIANLRKSLATGNHSPLTALMSCILFVCFDSIRGHFTAAMVHLQSGLRILRAVRKRPSPSHDAFMIENTIVPVLLRLSVQAILYIDTCNTEIRRTFASELMKTNEKQIKIPIAFSSLEEARNNLNQSADGLFRTFYMCDGDLPHCYQPAESFELHARYSFQLTKWNKAFENFMTANSHSLSSKELRGAALLKIQHICVKVMADCSVPDITDTRTIANIVNSTETFASVAKEFQTIVMLARSLVAAAEQDAKSGKSPLTFGIDLGLIAPLYYVCIHCTESSVREAALEVIKRYPRREGMWDGERLVQMIGEYWTIKQQHNDLLQQSESGPECYVPLRDMVRLKLEDGMRWEWKWTDNDEERGKSADVDEMYPFTDIFADKSLFGSFFQMPGCDT